MKVNIRDTNTVVLQAENSLEEDLLDRWSAMYAEDDRQAYSITRVSVKKPIGEWARMTIRFEPYIAI